MKTQDAIVAATFGATVLGVIALAISAPDTQLHDIATPQVASARPAVAPDKPVPVGDGLKMGVLLEEPLMLPDDRTNVAVVEIKAPEAPGNIERQPVAMVAVIDVSNSMDGNKFTNAKKSVRELILGLSPGDSFSLVSFSDKAEVLLDKHPLGEGEAYRAIEAVDNLTLDGMTCISCGLSSAYRILKSAPETHQRRILLLSDGEANEGIKDERLMGELASRGLDYHRILTSSIGLGKGIDPTLLSQMSNSGGGSYYFVRNSSVIGDVLSKELDAASSSAATGLSVRLKLPEGVSIDTSTPWWNGSDETLIVGRLAWGQSRRWAVPLRVPEGHRGQMVEAHLSYFEPDGDETTLAATANVRQTQRRGAAAAAVNPDVTTEVIRLSTSDAINRALAMQQKGESEAASALLNRQLMSLAALDGQADADILQQQRKELRHTVDNLPSYEPGSLALRGAVLLNQACKNEIQQGVAQDAIHHVFLRDADIELE